MDITKGRTEISQKPFEYSAVANGSRPITHVDGRPITYMVAENGMYNFTAKSSGNTVSVGCLLLPGRAIRVRDISLEVGPRETPLDFHKVMQESGIIKGMLRFASRNGIGIEVPSYIKDLAISEKVNMRLPNVEIRLRK